ncbi:MAG TPA: PEP-CTERM sorting domain-containing protein [Phycisphaerae bacterium]|nr:PEP-CTERM sorting domain-containing protein [Phycisphaerae bacterium]
MITRGFSRAVLLLVPAFAVGPAFATPLPVGSNITVQGIVLADHPELQGTTIFAESSGYYGSYQLADSPRVEEAGTFTTTVVRENATGTLDYYYQATPTSEPSTAEALSISPFDPSLVLDADYVRAAGTSPRDVEIERDARNIVVSHGTNLLLRTDLTQLDNVGGQALVLLSEFTPAEETDPTLVPSESIAAPEPATVALLPLAMGALWMRVRRRRC